MGAGLIRVGVTLIALLTFLSPIAYGEARALPPLSGRVVDTEDVLSAAARRVLSGELAALERQRGAQVAVLIIDSTSPETIEQFGIRLAENWKLGRKGVDDGAILIVATEDREVRIEVGYGLEGALTDATSKRIIEETIIPRFRAGDLTGGILKGVAAIIKVVEGESLPPPAPRPGRLASGESGGDSERGFYALFIGIIVGSFVANLLGRVVGGMAAGISTLIAGLLLTNVIVAALLALLALVLVGLGRTGGGGYSGRSGGWHSRSSSSSWGGGGFGGGGGSFGGGGASGRW